MSDNRGVMSQSSGASIAHLEDQLDGASRSLSSLHALNARQVERVAACMDRLASQLLEVSPPAAIEAVHRRLGTSPASNEDSSSVVDQMGAADGEG